MVRHEGRSVTFDWGKQASSVNWAAFYSDCEHEVLEVTSGHRLTVTYNLYVVRGNGTLAGHCPILDPSRLPLYKTIHDLVGLKDEWVKGELVSNFATCMTS